MVEDQSDDLWGLAFLLLAVLAGLGIYAGVIGPAGHALRTGTADLFGLARYGLPPGFAVLGGYLILRHARSEPGRVAVGLALGLMAAAGLLCVLTGRDTLHQPLAAMGRAGGLLGAAEGVPLQAGLASWGAGLVFGAAGFVACLIVTATPVRAVAARLRSLCTAAAHAARWSWYVCTDLARGGQRLASAARHPSVRGPGLARRRVPPSHDVIDLAAPAAGPAGLSVTSRRPDWAAPDGRHDAEDDNAQDDDASVDGSGEEGARGGPLLEGVVAGGRAAATALGQPGPPPISITGLAGRGAAGPGKAQQLAIDLGLPRAMSPAWRLPPMALLRRSKHTEVDRRQIEVLGQTLESALAAHGVETRLVAATVGPSVTRYELELGPGVKVQKVTALQRDIAYALAAADVRILAPIPGKSAIGVEVPNRQRQTVTLGDILGSPEAAAARHPLEVAAGRDIAGRPVLVNLAEMPHLLIAGATGSGKSSCINSMLTSLLMRATPDQVRLILVDPKRVELGHYTGLPHLLTAVVTNPKKAANALHWAVQEMERRYDLLAEVGMRDITGYNAAWDRGELSGDPEGDLPGRGEGPSDIPDGGPGAGNGALQEEPAGAAHYTRLPFIVVVVDELNDLMMVAARDVEESICRIAQMARAVGIHLVLATQRPSVDVITGLIKANIPSRLAFAVSSLADSRVVLDQPGAERLIGKGDMLLLTASSSQARRIQGPWADEEDIRKIVGHWRRQAGPSYVDGVDGPDATAGALGEDADDDELLDSAMQLVVRSQLGSTSMLQRKLRVGFARAGRLMDLLEQRGVVGESEGSKARTVLMTIEEFEGR